MPRLLRASFGKAAPWPGCAASICSAGWRQGAFSVSVTRAGPSVPSPISRLAGGSSVRSGTPRTTTVAPSHSGASRGTPSRAAISAISSSERIESWRTLRISVPGAYCRRTRTQAGRVSP